MATEQILDYVNKIVVVPGRYVAIQTGPGLSVKDVILPGEFIQVEIKAKSILLGFQKHIQHWLKDIAPVSYHVKSSNDSSTIVIFEDKKLANDSYKKLPALFHAHGKTIDYDKFANTFAPPDLDQVGTSSDSPSSSKACANIPAKPELLMSSIFVDEPALPPIVPNDYSIKTCSICYTDFHAHEFITLECGHFFCPMCIYNA
uniref:RING-type domain-containing protein n=1 Tax=Acrobeloides nanus TaxID=290746 RepID=A0A914BUE7_9BILA